MKREPLIRAWAGFIDGRLDIETEPRPLEHYDSYGALYRTKKIAKQFYDDVRRIVIYEDAP